MRRMSGKQNPKDTEQSVVIDAAHHRVRLDKTVKDLFDVPWSTARHWIEGGKISVNATVVNSLEATVSEGGTLHYSPNARRPFAEGQFNPKCIVYKDAHLIVANKPADILTVPYEEGDKNTFDMQIRGYLTWKRPPNAKKKAAMAPLLVVHRLDKLTSGLLVFPRTLKAKEGLSVQFRNHSIVRHYLALVHGLARPGTITTHIMQDRGDGIRGSCETSVLGKVRRNPQGQVAITHVEVVELLKNATFVKCILETGRTNQIRIHMAEQGHPLIGERIYMRDYKGKEIDSPRLMLHAAELGFLHPVTGERLHFTAEPPPHFEQMVQRLKMTPA
ncbi:MAG: RluA family pseudouridine synthase [Deltaproteobacteria bacterium]|nr:RluA family pseudouridine synthase [Deltaproteobacteria bacterium]